MNFEKKRLKLWELIILHLLPGIIIGLGYGLLLRTNLFHHYPKVFVLGVVVLIFLIPSEIGILLLTAKKENNNLNIFQVLGLKSKLKLGEYLLYTILLFILSGILITVLKPVSDNLLSHVFQWIPDWYLLNEDMTLYSRNAIVVTIIIEFVTLTLLGPITEELYFRGFLMSRMKRLGGYSVLINTVLFALYHVWTPWLLIARIVGMLPLFYIVYKKDSLKLSITVHCLCNFTDVAALIMLL